MPEAVLPARSRLMSRIGPKDTQPELFVRRMLHTRGWRYRLHAKTLPGTPDIVFPGRRAVLFVHGCFWHGHDCRSGRLPKTRRAFWAAKIAANRSRDSRKVAELVERGWRVMTVWQCSLKRSDSALAAIENFLRRGCSIAETGPDGDRETLGG